MSDFKDHLLVNDDVRAEIEKLLRGHPITDEGSLNAFKQEVMIAVATAKIPPGSAEVINQMANEIYVTCKRKEQMEIAAGAPEVTGPARLPGARNVKPLVLEAHFDPVRVGKSNDE